jgi:hypothetical protein
MNQNVLTLAARAVDEGQTRLRTLLAGAVDAGLRVSGHRFSKAIDLDRPADLEQAERFLSELKESTCSH